MNLIKKFMYQGNKSDLLTLPSGEFDLLRSKKSPRSSLECIYSDASLSIRDAGKFRYELIVKKVSDDGDTILGEDDEDFSDDTRSVLSVQSKKKEEEWSFSFSKDLAFLKTWTKKGDVAFVWKNLNGDELGEKVQFVLSHDVQHHDIERFLDAIYCCYYESKYQRPSLSASPEIMKEIELICNTASAVSEDDSDSDDNIPSVDRYDGSDHEEFTDANDSMGAIRNSQSKNSLIPKRAPSPPQNVPDGKQFLLLNADLYLFDPMAEKFLKQESSLKVSIIDVGSYNYWLSVEGKDNRLGTDISANINPTFESSKKSFVFNYTFENITLSYMLRFIDVKDFKKFRSTWTETVWMSLNRDDWNTLPAIEKEYINDPADSLTQQLDDILHIDGRNEGRSESAIDSSSSEEDEDEDDNSEYSSTLLSSTSFGEDNKSVLSGKNSTRGNQSLTVSSKNNRSYVIRDNKIGVFKTGDDLEFVTTIKNVTNLKGDSFTPLTPMMYMEDSSMILSDSLNKNKLYKMDLNRGSIVEEWGTGDKDVVQYGPTKKFDQLTAEQTFVGVSSNGMFKIDPRISSGNKIAVDQSKEYKSKCNFSSISTTESGYVAVGSEKGDIKLFDRLGIRAKTAIPSLGEPIRHMCTSADGSWLLVTCDNMFMLMDLTV